jgi:hypothetical protein
MIKCVPHVDKSVALDVCNFIIGKFQSLQTVNVLERVVLDSLKPAVGHFQLFQVGPEFGKIFRRESRLVESRQGQNTQVSQPEETKIQRDYYFSVQTTSASVEWI